MRQKGWTPQTTSRCPQPQSCLRYPEILCKCRHLLRKNNPWNIKKAILFCLLFCLYVGKSWSHKRATGTNKSHCRGLQEAPNSSRCGQKTGIVPSISAQTIWVVDFKMLLVITPLILLKLQTDVYSFRTSTAQMKTFSCWQKWQQAKFKFW